MSEFFKAKLSGQLLPFFHCCHLPCSRTYGCCYVLDIDCSDVRNSLKLQTDCVT